MTDLFIWVQSLSNVVMQLAAGLKGFLCLLYGTH